MKTENPDWGAPRIHGELLQLGRDVSEPTVSRYLRRLKRRTDREKARRWLAFLENHREVVAAFVTPVRLVSGSLTHTDSARFSRFFRRFLPHCRVARAANVRTCCTDSVPVRHGRSLPS